MSEYHLNDEHWQDSSSDFDQLELMVRAAGNYVQPTDDLRPKSLEAARDACRKRRTGRRLGGLSLLVIFLAMTGLPTFMLSAYPGLAVVPSSEMHRRAARNMVENGAEINWALCEAFYELRCEHSEMLNQSD